MNYEATQTLSGQKFKRRFGVQRAIFNRMVKGIKAQIPELSHPGRPPKLSIADQILVALEYWQEYRPYFHIATDKRYRNRPCVISFIVSKLKSLADYHLHNTNNEGVWLIF